LKWWDQLFGKQKSDQPEKSPYLPEEKVSKDVGFAQNFTDKGGFFLFCENKKQILKNFVEILKENHWTSEDILCFDTNLAPVFDLPLTKIEATNKTFKAGLFLCEYLISNTGSILFCHHQIKHFKMHQLPKTLIVYASAKQFVSDVSEGMTLLKNKYNKEIPTNISAINCQEDKQNEGPSSPQNSSKNIYLLLQDHSL